MAQESTIRKLADLTDAGVFERLATAILRSDYRYTSLTHPGINADGKTVKSPLDGITFLLGSSPPQMIAVHHTICAAKDLDKKWLHNPAHVKPRGKKPTAPAGDILKTIEIIEEERKRITNLQAVLILTTNQEPDESLLRDVHATGTSAGIGIDVWSRSRLADYLDNEPRGQWLRRQFFGIDQVLLSHELLNELSKKSLDIHCPPDQADAWVDRALDLKIRDSKEAQILFVVARSGEGKTVACYKRLNANVEVGGYALILTDDIVSSSSSIDQAVENALLKLCPSLMHGCGAAALTLSNAKEQLIITVEDINRSGRGNILLEKIARWGNWGEAQAINSWQLLCPVWPQVISSLEDDIRKKINKSCLMGLAFSPAEGTKAVKRRRELSGHPVTELEAAQVSIALGHDPLLIALHDPIDTPNLIETISKFVENCLQRLTITKGEFSAAEYHKSLVRVAEAMLLQRNMEPSWIELIEWPQIKDQIPALRHILHKGEVVRLTGLSADEKLKFRHDRVREWLLAQAAFGLVRNNAIPKEIIAEPYFAEIFGLSLTNQNISVNEISMIAANNTLALFCAVKYFQKDITSSQSAIILELEGWLNNPQSHTTQYNYLRAEALRALSEIDCSVIPSLISKFKEKSSNWNALRARYRNGDLLGGFGLCFEIEPGMNVGGYDYFHEHVKKKFGDKLINQLASTLNSDQLDKPVLVGALRLAGHLGDPILANAIRACWQNNDIRKNHLEEFLWAGAQCVDDEPATLLGPICDEWASLPSENEEKGYLSPRDDLAADQIRWAFQKRLPNKAVQYFISRANQSDLKWPITYMLHGVNDPDAVEFIAKELAVISEKLEGTNNSSHFDISAADEWKRQLEINNRTMSEPSRIRLQNIWGNESNKKHLREQAFRLWASAYHPSHLEILRSLPNTIVLAEKILWARLRLGDLDVIPELIEKISGDEAGYWWQLGRYIWSSDLTIALDKALEHRREIIKSENHLEDNAYHLDWILRDLIMRLPIKEAESLLNKHWEQLYNYGDYVVAALRVSTPSLLEKIDTAIKSTAEPKKLLKHFSMQFGLKRQDFPKLTHSGQIEALIPYLDLLDNRDIYYLWEECNERGWFALRHTYLDSRFPSSMRGWEYLDPLRAMESLDKFLEERRQWQVTFWIDQFLKTGVSLDHLMSIIKTWLNGKSDIKSLELACTAVLHVGERRHIKFLRSVPIEPKEKADAIIIDTEYGVHRRTLLI
jgi:hypothetical protein